MPKRKEARLWASVAGREKWDDQPEHRPSKRRTARSFYFAYGSNLCLKQMHRRCPSSEFSGTGRLEGWKLAFVGRSGFWGGAIATMVQDARRTVEGVIYTIADDDILKLDAYEGTYTPRAVSVLDGMNRVVRCRCYILTGEQPSVPGPRYFAQIQQAYMDYSFDLRPLFRAATEGIR